MKSRYRLPNYAEIIRGNAPLLTKKKMFLSKMDAIMRFPRNDGKMAGLFRSSLLLARYLKMECTVLGWRGSLTFRCILAVSLHTQNVLSLNATINRN